MKGLVSPRIQKNVVGGRKTSNRTRLPCSCVWECWCSSRPSSSFLKRGAFAGLLPTFNQAQEGFQGTTRSSGSLTRPNVVRRLFLFHFTNSLATVTQRSGDCLAVIVVMNQFQGSLGGAGKMVRDQCPCFSSFYSVIKTNLICNSIKISQKETLVPHQNSSCGEFWELFSL